MQRDKLQFIGVIKNEISKNNTKNIITHIINSNNYEFYIGKYGNKNNYKGNNG